LKNKYLYKKISLDLPIEYDTGSGLVVIYTHTSPAKKTINEDSTGYLRLDNKHIILIIADGLGGLPTGANASSIALDSITDELEMTCSGELTRNAIISAFEKANQEILNTTTGSATTLAVAEIQHNILRTYHTGDSPIMLCGQRGKLKFLTISHSPVGYAVEAGILDEIEAIHHDERHYVSNVVGSTDMTISIGAPIQLAQFDTLLLSSDGLFDNLYQEEIIDIIRKGNLAQAAVQLKTVALKRMQTPQNSVPHWPDDLSFILYRPKS